MFFAVIKTDVFRRNKNGHIPYKSFVRVYINYTTMGVDFECGDKSYSCGYGRWNNIRRSIIYATYLYVREYNNPDDVHSLIYKHVLLTMFDGCIIWNSAHTGAVGMIIQECHESNSIIDSMNYFGLVGLYALCYKSDCDGFYSPGNSLDICILLDKIKDTFEQCRVDTSEQECIYNCEWGIYSVFDTSYKMLSNVMIY
jgi:hypothetical protein